MGLPERRPGPDHRSPDAAVAGSYSRPGAHARDMDRQRIIALFLVLLMVLSSVALVVSSF